MISANDVLIGGTTPAQRNVVASGGFAGITINPPASNVTISGNYIGTDVSGMQAVPNRGNGISIFISPNGRSDGITIGGTAPGAGNVIAGNTGTGILVGTSSNVSILGNQIGVAADGVTPLGNGSYGVIVAPGAGAVTVGDLSGGGNVITYNASGQVVSASDATTVRGNSAFPNAFNISQGINPSSVHVSSA